MKLSAFGQKMTNNSGILQLMDDLGKANAGGNMLMLGGGNPAHIPEVEKIWRSRMEEILKNGDELERMLGNYTTPQGDTDFTEALAGMLKKEFDWNISSKNIAVVHGGQTGFFFLFNLLAGQGKKILFPLVPEYIGYADQGITEDMFVSVKPIIEYIDEHTFKYKIDFDNLKITEDIAAICVSRPTNPTGNVITNEEIEHLSILAKEHDIPLIVDNAYGLPFPSIIFNDAKPIWNEHMINFMSLSKIGLPSTRTGMVIASEEVVRYLSGINAIISLSTNTIGQRLTLPLIKSGEIIEMSHDYIRPYYEKKVKHATEFFHQEMKDSTVPYYLHKTEGALFLWLWLKDFPITTVELYNRLKKRGVLVVPGEYFFPGYDAEWQHKHECIRITYSQQNEVVEKGLAIIADEVKKIYG